MKVPPMHKNHFPIETEEAYKFWASRHICNRMKAIIAFSTDLDDAKNNLRRFGYAYHFRARALHAYQNYIAKPEMETIPFTPLGVDWWDCMPRDPLPPPSGRWVLWEDREQWEEDRGDLWDQWVEWIDDKDIPPVLPVPPKP
ncbi:MAG: hypothetical protein ACRC6V_01340 [Bacteroidales bacterium]